jgi:5-methylcytosine-specific restriction endonuclease McrA
MCLIDPVTRNVTRIFKYPGTAAFHLPDYVAEYSKAYAIKNVRRQVFAASKGECRNCGELITWATMHMHDQQPKGSGGEVSIHNSVGLCADCHLNQEHKRAPQFTRRSK